MAEWLKCGGVAELRCGRLAECRKGGGVAEWRIGGVSVWPSGGVAECDESSDRVHAHAWRELSKVINWGRRTLFQKWTHDLQMLRCK